MPVIRFNRRSRETLLPCRLARISYFLTASAAAATRGAGLTPSGNRTKPGTDTC